MQLVYKVSEICLLKSTKSFQFNISAIIIEKEESVKVSGAENVISKSSSNSGLVYYVHFGKGIDLSLSSHGSNQNVNWASCP